MKVLSDFERAAARNQSRLCPSGQYLRFSPDALQFLFRAFQASGLKKHRSLPGLRVAFGALPCVFLVKAPINQGPQMLAVPPMVKLKRVNRALKAQPEDVCPKS